ncbi:MAG: tannase/feruloyl esterase family alpha/beta hydrolase, partial [Oscillospiraceae bacterium]|nr:tannase/feruloyl esterase family alpha/beta hydrolase [Oscillospiraceae bacterium]
MDQKLQELRMTPIEHGVVTDVQLVEAGAPASFPGLPVGPAPEHIKVCVTCKPEEGSNIRIEVWLPTDGWNGDLVGVGNGGAAGHILPFVMVGPLRLGFAVTTTDMGTSAGPDCGIGNKAVWKDFGYRSTHLMTLAAKAIVENFYGVPPKHSFFTGSSTGGQQALMEAQRYPEDYDGILASAPAWDRVNLHLGFLWDWMALNKGETALFSKEDADKIVKTILNQCGTEGGRRPGDDFMYHPHKLVMS